MPILADYIGRKLTIVIGILGFSVLLFIVSFLHELYSIIVLSSLSMICSTITCYISFQLLGEITAAKLRSLFGGIVNSGFNICAFVYILIYKFSDSWRTVFITSSTVTFCSGVIFYIYAIESPKFYIIKKDFIEYINCLRGIAARNRRRTVFNTFYSQEEKNLKVNFIELLEINTNTAGANNEKNGHLNSNPTSKDQDNDNHKKISDNTAGANNEKKVISIRIVPQKLKMMIVMKKYRIKNLLTFQQCTSLRKLKIYIITFRNMYTHRLIW